MGLGREPKWETARAEMSPSPREGEEQAGYLLLSTLAGQGGCPDSQLAELICSPAKHTSPQYPS